MHLTVQQDARMLNWSRTSRWLALAIGIPVMVSCGVRSASTPLNAVPEPDPEAIIAPPTPSADSWVMQSGNVQRNGFQSAPVGLTSANAASLTLLWSDDLGDQIQASPIVANGIVYVATVGGEMFALSAATGSIIWMTALHGFVRATPTLDGSTLIVTMHGTGAVAALDAKTGATLWLTPSSAWTSAAPVRSEALVQNGIVYVGTAGGDLPTCDSGTVEALSEITGAPLWTWKAASPGQGVGVWSPISLTSSGDVLVGTGNPCETGDKYNESVVALNAVTGAFDWQAITSRQGPDVDVGGGVAIASNSGFFSGKDGNLYAISLANGTPMWHVNLGSVPGYGSIATPATDGSNVITQSGALRDPAQNAAAGSKLFNYSIAGNLKWAAGPFQDEEFSSPVITGDVVVVDIDNMLQVRSLQNGTLLFSYDLGSFVYASPAVVSSGIYTASTGGKVVALGNGGVAPSAAIRHVHVAARSLAPWRPWQNAPTENPH